MTKLKHLLVSPRRGVNRFLDLTSEEVSDLWLAAKHIGKKLGPYYKASSLTFTIQVHMHILLFLWLRHLLGHHNEDGNN